MFVSDHMAESQGRSKKELLSLPFAESMVPKDRKQAWLLLQQVFDSGEPVRNFTAEHQRGGGEQAFRTVSLVPVKDANGEVVEVQTFSVDVTDQVKMRRQLELYASMVRQAQENERLRISRFIHDDTIQSLLAVSRSIELALGSPEKSDANEAREHLHWARQVVLDQIDALRRLSLTLRPVVLDHMGLDAAIRWLVRNACRDGNVTGTVDVGENWHRLSPDIEVRLFRIAQEAVNNAVRHGNPRNVNVSLDTDGEWLELVIADDGIGFETSDSGLDLLRKGKMGLAGLQERVNELGATLRMVSGSGKGSSIVVQGRITDAEHVSRSRTTKGLVSVDSPVHPIDR